MECREYQVSCYKPSIEELRYSIGLGLTWIIGFGPMSFAISNPTMKIDMKELKNSVHYWNSVLNFISVFMHFNIEYTNLKGAYYEEISYIHCMSGISRLIFCKCTFARMLL